MLQMKKNYVLSFSVVFFIAGAICSTAQKTISSELNIPKPKQHKVLLTPLLKSISPDPVEVRRGEIVVWHNKDTKPVVIVFTPGIAMACSSSTITFPADQEGFYETAKIPPGGTVSMCFIIEGEVDYGISREMEVVKEKPEERIVRKKPIEYILQGKVIVKK